MKDTQAVVTPAAPEFTIGRVSRFSRKEEVANATSHFVGAGFALVALLYLLYDSIQLGNTYFIAGSSIFGASMIAMYVSSAMTHALPTGRAKNVFYNLDQVTIYILIAGTYTPFALAMANDWGWLILGIEWALALGGVVMKLLMPGAFERGANVVIIASYIMMGWLVIFFIEPFLRNIDPAALRLIFIGGALYTVGIFFYKMKKLTYAHLIWHLMVLMGSVVHFSAVIRYVLK